MIGQSIVKDSEEDFEALLEDFFATQEIAEGSILKGKILGIQNDEVILDVGLKAEGRVPLKEFTSQGQDPELAVGDIVEVFLEKIEGKNGEALLSREKAKREAVWQDLEVQMKNKAQVQGVIFGRVKGGFAVDLSGAIAFLPGSQVDVRPIRDAEPLMGISQPFKILKMDRARSNIVVSRRAVMEGSRDEARAELMSGLEEGQVIQGIVKNILDYGAFIDLGGVDGLLHVTDLAWKRIQHPEEILSIGETISVKIIKFNPESKRISLGLKQLTPDPWDHVSDQFKVGQRLKGRVTNVTDYGAFVALSEGVEGLIHVSEMGWNKKNITPGKIVSTSREVEVMILDVDVVKRRISLGLKQCIENPWEKVLEQYPVGCDFESQIKNITEFGLFVALTPDIDGMVHLSDLSWDKNGEELLAQYKIGDTIRVKVLDIEPQKERISLGVKQLTPDPHEKKFSSLSKGEIVSCRVTDILDTGIEVVLIESELSGFVRKSELSRERDEQRPNLFSVGQIIEAKITAIDRNGRKVILSIKGRELDEEAQAMAENRSFNESVNSSHLGELLGEAISRANEKKMSPED